MTFLTLCGDHLRPGSPFSMKESCEFEKDAPVVLSIQVLEQSTERSGPTQGITTVELSKTGSALDGSWMYIVIYTVAQPGHHERYERFPKLSS